MGLVFQSPHPPRTKKLDSMENIAHIWRVFTLHNLFHPLVIDSYQKMENGFMFQVENEANKHPSCMDTNC